MNKQENKSNKYKDQNKSEISEQDHEPVSLVDAFSKNIKKALEYNPKKMEKKRRG